MNTYSQQQEVESSAEIQQLEGLPANCWAAYVLLNKRLVVGGLQPRFVDGRIWLPPVAGLPAEQLLDVEPVLHDVIGLDLGKAQIKTGGISDTHHFCSHVMVDAYCRARAIQHETGVGKSNGNGHASGMTTYRLTSEHGIELENAQGFWVSTDALRWAEKLPITDTHIRLKQSRVRELYYASIVEQLIAMGREPSWIGEESPDADQPVQTHYIVVSLGLPYSDVTPLQPATREAIRSLFGGFTLQRENTLTGESETWCVHITTMFAYAQTRGTDDAWGMALSGEPSQTEVIARTIIDPGGGDAHVFHVTETGTGSVNFIGDYLGRGTIELAEALQAAVKQKYGIQLSEPEAQQVLYTREIIGPGGKRIRIDDIIDELGPKRENLLTRLNITPDMRSTLIIFTSGGTALLHDELKRKLEDEGLKEGLNYIVVPARISTTMNAIGLTARGLYKAQSEEQKIYATWVNWLVNAYTKAFGQCPLEQWQLRNELSKKLTTLQHWQEGDSILSWTMVKPFYDYIQAM